MVKSERKKNETEPTPKSNLDTALRAELALIDEEELAVARLAEAERKLSASVAKLAEVSELVEKRQAAFARAKEALDDARERRSAGLPSSLTPPEVHKTEVVRPDRD